MESTTPARPSQPANPTFLVQSRDQIAHDWPICPNAQTLLAYSATLATDVVISVSCKKWSCRYCAANKIRQLAAKTREAKPNRLLTLTCNPKLYATPREAFDATRRQLPVLLTFLRKRFGDIEYLRVTELTKRGYPHYHLLIRSGYLPHPVVRDQWAHLTGAVIVDLRQVKQSFAAYTYLVKYLSKLHKIEWTERHVSYSRGFFPPTPSKTEDRLSLERCEVANQHPTNYLIEFLPNATLRILSPSTLQVLPQPPN